MCIESVESLEVGGEHEFFFGVEGHEFDVDAMEVDSSPGCWDVYLGMRVTETG